MKLKIFLLLGILCTSVYAAEQPKELQPAPPPPPLDANAKDEPPEAEPQVTITTQGEQTVEEYRVSGKLYMIKITPKHGKPYYLVDDRGDGRFARREGLDSGVRVPRWVIHSF